jgi:hypothetical protein
MLDGGKMATTHAFRKLADRVSTWGLRDMGLMLCEIWNLEGLAADFASDHRYEFFLTAPPLRVTGAVRSPLNPVAPK